MRMYNDAVWSLNWLSGTAAWRHPPGNPARHKGHEVAARLRRLVFSEPTSAEAPVPEADLMAEESTRWAPRVWISRHTVQLVSLPANLDGSPELADLFASFWMANMSLFEERWRKRMLWWKTVGSSGLTWTVLSGTTRSGT